MTRFFPNAVSTGALALFPPRCSAASAGGGVYSKAGVFASVCYQRLNPAGVLVDVGIIAAAPTRFLVAGMGDALSTWFEARSCERTQSANECGGYSTAAR